MLMWTKPLHTASQVNNYSFSSAFSITGVRRYRQTVNVQFHCMFLMIASIVNLYTMFYFVLEGKWDDIEDLCSYPFKENVRWSTKKKEKLWTMIFLGKTMTLPSSISVQRNHFKDRVSVKISLKTYFSLLLII